MTVHFQTVTALLFAATASIRRLPRINFLLKNSWPSADVRGGPIIVNQRRYTARWCTYTVGIVHNRRYRERARRSADRKWLTLHPSPRRSPYTGTRCPYAVLHCYTIAYATLRTRKILCQLWVFQPLYTIVR